MFWTITAGGLALGLAVSLRYTFWRPNLSGVPALMYHYIEDGVADTRLPKLRVRPAAFARQMAWLHRHGYRAVTPTQLVREPERAGGRAVIVTFDDGCRESLIRAQAIMSRFGFVGAVFAVADQVGGVNAWDRDKGEPMRPLAGWAQLRGLIDDGWEVGSHTRNHAELTRLGPEALDEELAGSRRALEEGLGRPVNGLAYPYGLTDDRVREAARRAGYIYGFTTRPGLNGADRDPMDLARIIIKRKDNRLDLALKMRKGRSTV